MSDEPESELPTMKQLRKQVAKSIKDKAMGATNRLIEKNDPKLALQIIEEYSNTGSPRHVSQKFGVDKMTVQRIARDHKEVIGTWREYAAGEAFLLKARSQALLHRKFDMMEDDEEQVKKTNIRDIAQAVSLMSEGYQNSIGEGPKAGITVNVGPTFEDVQRHLEELRAKITGKPIRVVTETPIDLC